MFYPSSSVESVLRCAYCLDKFVNVVKIIPDCGKSICGQCYQALQSSLTETSSYECHACGKQHLMPKEGLADVKAIMDLLQLKPQERALSERAKALKFLIEEVEEKVDRLKNLDEQEEINIYCDTLLIEVVATVERGIEHLNQIGEELAKEINEYRQSLLDSKSSVPPASKRLKASPALDSTAEQVGAPNDPFIQQEIAKLSEEIKEFSSRWDEYFSHINKTASEQEIEWARKQYEDYFDNLERLEQRVMVHVFNGRFLRLSGNQHFFESTDHLGEMVQENALMESNLKGELLHTLDDFPGEIWQVLFLQDGTLATCSDECAIKIWNADTGKMLCKLKGHSEPIYCLAQLENGWLASGSLDNSIRIWDLKARQLVRTLLGHTDSVFSLKVLLNGNLASCSYDNTIKIWNPYLNKNHLLFTIEGQESPLFDLELNILSNGFLVTCSNTAYQNNTIKIWNPYNGELVESIPFDCPDASSFVTLSNDTVAVGFKNGRIHIIDLSNESTELTLMNNGGVWAQLQLANGCLASAGDDAESTIKIWDISEGKLVEAIQTGHSDGISSLSVSPDGRFLASGSYDKTVRIWSLTY